MERRPSCVCIRKKYVKRKKFRAFIIYTAFSILFLLCGIKFFWSLFLAGIFLIAFQAFLKYKGG